MSKLLSAGLMFTLYLVVLGGAAIAAVALLAVMAGRMFRRPAHRDVALQLLAETRHAERRTRSLPFVGAERRHRANSVQMILDLAEAQRAA